jgi:hypothetical protein
VLLVPLFGQSQKVNSAKFAREEVVVDHPFGRCGPAP